MSGMIDATALTGADGSYRANIDADWMALGPFGGYMGAMSLRAMGAESPGSRPASFSCQFIAGGVVGPVDVAVEKIKPGRRAECLEARISQGGKLLLTAQSWMLADQAEFMQYDHARPPGVSDPASATDLPGEATHPMWQHVVRRLPSDATPVHETGHMPCWYNLVETFDRADPVSAAMTMCFWMDLACWIVISRTKDRSQGFISPTLDMSIQFQPGLYAQPLGHWQLAAADTTAAGLGLVGSRAGIWSEDGVFLAHGATQCMSVKLN